MQVNLVEKNALFMFDEKGVIIITDIEKNSAITIGELIYDGKNVAILNRNNKDFFALKNIAPLIRDKIKKSKNVTIIEKDNNDMYSYMVEVHLKDDLGFEDNFSKYAQGVIAELKKKMPPKDFEAFMSEAEKFAKENAM